MFQIFGMAMQQRQGHKNAQLLRAQGRAAEAQSVADADALSREYRQIAGRQAAQIAQSGGGYEGSAAKLLHQSETLAFLDRLNVRYHGRMRRRGFEADAKSVRRNADAQFIAGVGSIASSMYGAS
jgi:hypothetical protein